MTKEEIQFFDAIASVWDKKESKSTPDKIRGLLDMVGVREGMSVLDLGTGTGVLLPELALRVGASGRILAVDGSGGMLAEARRKNGSLINVDFLELDFESGDIPGRYDLVILYCVYPHLSDPVGTLHKIMAHNLNSQGRVVIGFPADERFINSIHADRDVESDLLPDAPGLVERLRRFGFNARVVAYSPEAYLVEIAV